MCQNETETKFISETEAVQTKQKCSLYFTTACYCWVTESPVTTKSCLVLSTSASDSGR